MSDETQEDFLKRNYCEQCAGHLSDGTGTVLTYCEHTQELGKMCSVFVQIIFLKDATT